MKQCSNADQCYTEAVAAYRKLSQGDDTVQIANALYSQGVKYHEQDNTVMLISVVLKHKLYLGSFHQMMTL